MYQAINVVAICKTKHLKEYGVNSILQPFIEELKVLREPTGCSVKVGSRDIHYRAALVAFCGDTPASNLISGFKERVGGAYRGCRECMAPKEEMQ